MGINVNVHDTVDANLKNTVFLLLVEVSCSNGEIDYIAGS